MRVASEVAQFFSEDVAVPRVIRPLRHRRDLRFPGRSSRPGATWHVLRQRRVRFGVKHYVAAVPLRRH